MLLRGLEVKDLAFVYVQGSAVWVTQMWLLQQKYMHTIAFYPIYV